LPAQIFSIDFVVRIYRYDKKNPRYLVGVVEEVGVKGKKAFSNYDELWDILISSKSTKPNMKRKIKKNSGPYDKIPDKGGKDENH